MRTHVQIFLMVLLAIFSTLSCSKSQPSEPRAAETKKTVAENNATWETMKYGLFVHYVYGGEYGGMTPLSSAGGYPSNIDDFVNRFNVEKWADDVAAMGFEYVIFTAWHANMNILYPSPVMDKWRGKGHSTTTRDLLGEIIDALIARGIKPAIYTHIWVGNDFHPQGDGYFYYGNVNGTITEDQKRTGYPESVHGNPTIWNNFVCEVYDEMSARYGSKIAAYWFDGTWTNTVDKNRIMESIKKYNPTCAFVANGTKSHGMPFSSKEVGSPEATDYGFASDYPPINNNDVKTWPSYERHVAIIQSGNWWANQWGKARFTAEAVFRYTVLQAATNNGGGVGWSFGPYADGSWEGDLFDVMKKANSYIDPIAESIKNTRASTSYPTREGTKISHLHYSRGFVATSSVDGLYEYIHVLVPPSANSVQLSTPQDGKQFESALLLAKNKPVNLEKKEQGYMLTLPNGETWDAIDTVIRLSVKSNS